MKRCSRCKIEKPIDAFNFKNKLLNIRQKACRDCTRAEIRNHYQGNRQYYLDKAIKRNSIIRLRNRTYVLAYLRKHFCVDCGEKDPVVLEFDHISNKKFDISSLIKDATIVNLQNEIKKCEVRCSNCHIRKTANQFNWYKKYLPL